jgi:predicted TIM-barrel fold metal-dependent hydrolase
MNVNFDKLAKMPVVDCHTHFLDPKRVRDILKVISIVGFNKVALLSLVDETKVNYNPEALLIKAQYPELFYAFGSLDYFSCFKGGESLPLPEQVDLMENIGFDGVKMVEGKPSVRKLLGIRFDSSFYEGYFERLEKRHVPLLFHVADPEEFWDPEKVPSWAREQGWFYDSTYPTKANLYEEVSNVLDKHSNLRVIFAHFYFLSGDIDAAYTFLDRYKNVFLDITPGIEMYYNFSNNHTSWRDFFIKYQDRILFGTDASSEQDVESAIARIWFVRNFLEMDSKFNLPSESDNLLKGPEETFTGLGLPETVLEKIYHNNFTNLVGCVPKKIKPDLAIEECYRLAAEEADLRGKSIRETYAATCAEELKSLL